MFSRLKSGVIDLSFMTDIVSGFWFFKPISGVIDPSAITEKVSGLRFSRVKSEV